MMPNLIKVLKRPPQNDNDNVLEIYINIHIEQANQRTSEYKFNVLILSPLQWLLIHHLFCLEMFEEQARDRARLNYVMWNVCVFYISKENYPVPHFHIVARRS